ncbi:MAG: NADH-quinone oxidoreductase subunit J [Chloroflexota bacterium]
MSWLIIAVFFALAALILTSSIMVVTAKSIIHAALWLISSFFGVGALYLLMEAEFIAVVQILVYVGAIAILVIIAVMLTPRITTENIRQLNSRWWATLAVVAALFGLLITPTVLFHQWNVVPPQEGQTIASVQELGEGFMRQYLLPFEVASILLLAALIGAVIIVFEERASRRKVLTLAEEVALRKRQKQAAVPAAAPAETKPVIQSPAQTSE